MDQPKMAEATNKETRADKKGPNKGTAPSKAETPKAAKKAGAGPINTGGPRPPRKGPTRA